MSENQSQQRLRQLVEQAVADGCNLPRPGLWFCVDAIEIHSRALDRLKVWAQLHFLLEGSPFYCGEPGCHVNLFGERLAEVEDHVRRALGFAHGASVDFSDRIKTNYHAGATFPKGTS